MTRGPRLLFFRRMLRCERGDPIVEFIFIVPLMLILGFGVMEVARILWYQHFITKGVRDGTRYLTRVPLADLGVAVDCVWVERDPTDCTMAPGEPIDGDHLDVDHLDVAACLALGGAHWNVADNTTVRVRLCPLDSVAFYGPDRTLEMSAQVDIRFPMLEAFIESGPPVSFTISNQARHIGQ
jgi:Flp pilus assembly protein TadG